jgi:hypothetical protein
VGVVQIRQGPLLCDEQTRGASCAARRIRTRRAHLLARTIPERQQDVAQWIRSRPRTSGASDVGVVQLR